MSVPLLGYITPAERTPEQQEAHAQALAHTTAFSLPMPQMFAGDKVQLFDFWTQPVVVKDVGFAFDRIHQLTGSCVWAGGTNALFSTIAAQRMAGVAPTKAFLPFTLHNYALSRHYMGDDGRGEGSLGSTFFKSLSTDGVRDWASGAGLPAYSHEDGISVTGREEMDWSSYRNPKIQEVLSTSRAHLISATGICHTVQDVRAMILNGYGASFACNNFIGHASVEGEGEDACVIGYWDGRGGHQQSIHAVWEHPKFGPLYWAQNNWPGNTYPRDPAGGPVCGCWVREAKVESAMQRLDAEVYGLSHLAWFPAQPDILDWFA